MPLMYVSVSYLSKVNSGGKVVDWTRTLSQDTNFPQSRPLVKDFQFGVSPVNYSDSDTCRLYEPMHPTHLSPLRV